MNREERLALEERYVRILREHGGALRRAAAAYAAGHADREDLVQEIALALWRGLPRFRGECSEKTFLLRIAHNRGLTHVWRRRPSGQDLSDAAEIADTAPDPEALAAGAQRQERLLEAVRRLPLGQRQIVALSLEGLAHREIAEVVGITENNVAVRLNRARAALKQALGAPGEEA